MLSTSMKAQVHLKNYKKRVKPRRNNTRSLRALSYIPKPKNSSLGNSLISLSSFFLFPSSIPSPPPILIPPFQCKVFNDHERLNP
ncbi:hypothetical protein glysoja_046072 [Glycine soja]|uniref:Uncharacterized protein n=1 Tax=Glycine soja TaxID=3848 RepID=A0A0B2RA51_GLYSO|nr:hypothetical protein glysoja_046072 [Glycine soja]